MSKRKWEKEFWKRFGDRNEWSQRYYNETLLKFIRQVEHQAFQKSVEIANGYGEDHIAGCIARAISKEARLDSGGGEGYEGD